MALVSQLVDVLSGIVLDALLFPFNTSERELVLIHINEFITKRSKNSSLMDSIMLFDRGYPSVFLFIKLMHSNIHFLMRSITAVSFLTECVTTIGSLRYFS